MKKIKLLFVEDDISFAFIVKGSLELTGLYDVRLAYDGMEGLNAYYEFNPEIIVSDIQMPVLNGMEMIQKIRCYDSDVAIMLATGLTSTRDVLEGYKLDIDNFIKKPFLPDELDAHIRAVIKRLRKEKIRELETVYIGIYSFDLETHLLYLGENKYKLTSRECKILKSLYKRKNHLVKRKELLNKLWGVNDFYSSRSLDVFINKLRKYLENDPSIQIDTVRKEGLILRC